MDVKDAGDAAMQSASVPPPLDWKLSQAFGERAAGGEFQEVDMISAIEFDKCGNHLATGDRGGRIVIFEKTNTRIHGRQKDLEKADFVTSGHPEFQYKTQFQSHEQEFDNLMSLAIGKRINKIKWCHPTNGALFLLSTNDNTIKFWKVASQETRPVARCRRIYAHAHDYQINSISNNSDGETFISADDLRINLWNLEISNQTFTIVDMKPVNMMNLVEVITSAEFHPIHCNTLAYSSTKGSIRLVDLRRSAFCDNHCQLFEEHKTPGSRSFFADITAKISDLKFGKDGRHILSRDYLDLKLWDIHMDSGPVATFQVHEYLKPKLLDLYENDSIFDKFDCCLSGDGQRVATGSYRNLFRIFGCVAGSNEATTLKASKNPLRCRRQSQNLARPAKSMGSRKRVRRGVETHGMDAEHYITTKLLHIAWHPTENFIACAAANSLYMYYA